MINYNGKIFSESTVAFHPNRASLYGDGLFETMRIHNGEILFFEDHCERMLSGMEALKLHVPSEFSPFFFHKQIVDLCHIENIQSNGRVRIGIFRGGGGLYEPAENRAEYFIDVNPMSTGWEWNEEHCEIGIFTDVRKNFSSISSFKTMNALPYVMASIFKKENQLGDCLLLNCFGKVADGVSSNIFWLENNTVFTPPLTDGGVAGVMQKNLIRILLENNFTFQYRSIVPEELLNADEVFLTNVIRGIKPVTQYRSRSYASQKTKEVFSRTLKSLLTKQG